MVGIAFHLGGAEFVRFDEDGVGDTGDRKCGGVEEGLAGDQLFRRFARTA